MALNNSSLSFSGIEVLKHPAIFGFRTLFYSVLPSESYFSEPSEVPAYIEHVSS